MATRRPSFRPIRDCPDARNVVQSNIFTNGFTPFVRIPHWWGKYKRNIRTLRVKVLIAKLKQGCGVGNMRISSTYSVPNFNGGCRKSSRIPIRTYWPS
jgi:hypothetical protein